MEIVEATWRVAAPLVFVGMSAAVLLGVLFRPDPPRFSWQDWLLGCFVLVMAGEAAFGDQRPLFERLWKAVAAALFGLALGIELWRRHLNRRRRGSRTPEVPSTRSDGPAAGAAQDLRTAGEVDRAGTSLAAGRTVFLTMPDIGQGNDGGTVTRWLKEVGETVEADEPLVEISTDKVDTELPSPATGLLLEIKAGQDDTVPVGAALAVIGVHPDRGVPHGV